MKRIFKLIAMLLVVMIAAVVIIPLVVLAGLFIWLKMTEEVDDEALELDEMGDDDTPA
jgi:cytochrome bd-type quinol oxidase subunit 2